MNAFIKPVFLFAILGAVAYNTQAQENNVTDNDKTIIIKPNVHSKDKYTIVVDGDKITINGKPVDEFKSDDVDIIQRNGRMNIGDDAELFNLPDSFPLKGWNGMGGNHFFMGTNKALLGVTTKKTDKGIEILTIMKESAADQAGLKKGDLIIKVDETTIENPEILNKVVGKHEPGDKVTITYIRNEQELKTYVTLGRNNNINMPHDFNWNNKDFNFRLPPSSGYPDFRYFNFENNRKPRLGIQIQDWETNKGAQVMNVEEDGPADKAGLKKDDIIISVNGKSVINAEEVKKAVNASPAGSTVKITYKRDSSTHTVEIAIPQKHKVVDL